MASTSRKRFSVSEEEIEELLEYESEENGSSDSDSDEVIEDRFELDVIKKYSDDSEEESEESFFWEDIQNYVGKREKFIGGFGSQGNASSMTDILDAFQLFFNEEFVSTIVKETNRYAEQYMTLSGPTLSKKSRIFSWKTVSVDEIYTVLGLFMLMGIIQKPSVRSYFSTKKVLSTPGFGDVITRDRFELICKFLHFTDNEDTLSCRGSPKLKKISPVISHLNKTFKEYYIPNRNISIDESSTLWKGRMSFKQYLPLKLSKFGIKTFELCDATNGYLWSLLIYTRKDTVFKSPICTQNSSKISAIVLNLVFPLLNQGRTLWMNNFYNSPDLAKLLKVSYGTDCVGTLGTNRKNISQKLQNKQLKKGEVAGQHCGPVSVIKWKDKRVVTMISTFHGIETKTIVKKGNELIKPVSVIDYNKYMGGVDLKNQLLQTYLIERKCLNKWYMKLFRRLLNSAVLNALIIYRENTDKTVNHFVFRVQLIEKLFMKYAKKDARMPGRYSAESLVPRLIERHFIRKIPPSGKKQHPQRRCVVCTKHSKRRDSVYFCENCDVGLCFDCFEIYHTKQNY